MERGKLVLQNPERFRGDYEISPEKLQTAIKKAVDKLAANIDRYSTGFPCDAGRDRVFGKYVMGNNDSWVSGMHTGTFLMAYELTGEKRFLEVAEKHLSSYIERFEEKRKMDTHDVGFAFSPSCVALYQLTGNEAAKDVALKAAKYTHEYSYSKKGKFIVRFGGVNTTNESGCRTMMDSIMNAPLLFWAGKVENDPELTQDAHDHVETTADYLIRPDGSSYHHYQFDVNTHAPVKGVTHQGNRHESTWTRGHAWGIYGFPVAYDYTRDDKFLAVHKDTVTYFLNNLPSDYVPYWDFDFGDGSGEPRDTSAGLISLCGMLEALKFLPKDAPEQTIYRNAAAHILEAVIDSYTGEGPAPYDGLVWGVTDARPFNIGLNDCVVYADYFYLEALLRFVKPTWERPW